MYLSLLSRRGEGHLCRASFPHPGLEVPTLCLFPVLPAYVEVFVQVWNLCQFPVSFLWELFHMYVALDVSVGEGGLHVLLSCHLDPISSDSLLKVPSLLKFPTCSCTFFTLYPTWFSVLNVVMLESLIFSVFWFVSAYLVLLFTPPCHGLYSCAALLWMAYNFWQTARQYKSKNIKAEVSRIYT